MKLKLNQPHTIEIYSKLIWNETDIDIADGEEYEFKAHGSWTDLFIKTDADGYSNLYMRLFDKVKRSKKNLWFALMGSLDKKNDFIIGKSNTIAVKQTGKLCCYANDAAGFYWNNSGHISLQITRIK